MLGGLNDHFATDAYGYSLGYFIGDYEAIEKDFLASTSTDPINTPSAYDVAAPSLYNGNIRQMVTVLLNEDEKRQTVHGTAYRYDQANRIKKSNVFTGVVNNSFEDATDNNYYKTTHNYDLNGNITQLNRYNNVGVWMDSLNYQYNNDGNGLYQSNGGAFTPGYDYRDGTFTGAPSVSNANKNQLTRVLDGKGVVNTTDFGTGGMLPQDFEYDEIGQLTKDLDEHIDTILWDVYGKVKEIRYYDASNLTRPDILFRYDPSGNRIAKILKTKDGSGNILTANNWDYYYYVRDASGNTMAVYEQDITHLSGNQYQSTLTLLERNIYGSSRLGTNNQQVVSISKFFATFTTTGGTTTTGTANYPTSSVVEVSGGGNITITDPSMEDLYLTIQALDNDVTLFAQNINVISGSLSYSPDGMLMLLANQQAEITCGYELELMNGGAPVNIQPMNSNTLTYTAANTINITSLFNFNKKQRTIGKKVYEKSNHLGNVHVVVSDRKLPVDDGTYSGGVKINSTPDDIFDYYEPDVVFAADYYNGVGMVMPGRLFVSQDHRYGAQGSEVDQEIDGTRDRITTYYRQGNLKTMRWDSPDPVTNPSVSPYAMNGNNGVRYNDPQGDCETCKLEGKFTLSFNFGTRGTSSFSLGLGVGASAGFGDEGGYRGAINTSARFYSGGLGSNKLSNPQFDVVVSPTIALGFPSGNGQSTISSPLSTFNRNNIDAVTNTDDFSFGISSNLVLNFGRGKAARFQRVGNFSLKANNLSLNVYNDFSRGIMGAISDGNDRYWTGGGGARWTFANGNSAFFATEVFTGQPSEVVPTIFNRYLDGVDYTRMKAGQGLFTDGRYYGGVSFNGYTVHGSISGDGLINTMGSQNFIHDNLGYPRFSTTYKQGFQLGGSYDSKF